MRLVQAVVLGVGLLAGAAMAQGQAAVLPKALYECDVMTARRVCSIWTLNGQIYEGSWPETGAVGRMTVVRLDATGVLITRVDTAGAMRGLTATYTGRWNGQQISGGQVSWTWNGHTSANAWTGSVSPPAKDRTQATR